MKKNLAVAGLMLLGTLVAGILLAGVKLARSETLCRDSPGHGKWVYRIIEGQRCWFEANGMRRGREKPREELAWPRYNTPEMVPVDRPPWAQPERRHPEGWDHQEGAESK